MGKNLLKQNNYMNRELSWLSFNDRILELVNEEQQPLLERLNFLAISQSNLDEWYEVRVASILHNINNGVKDEDPSGLDPEEELKVVRKAVKNQLLSQFISYKKLLIDLKKIGIKIIPYDKLNKIQKANIKGQFNALIKPIVEVSIVGKDQGWPRLAPIDQAVIVEFNDSKDYGNIKLTSEIPELLQVEDTLVFVETIDIISAFAQNFFHQHEVESAYPYRVIRDAYMPDIPVDTKDVAAAVADDLDNLKTSEYIHLAISGQTPRTVIDDLIEVLPVNPANVFKVRNQLSFSFVSELKGYLKNTKDFNLEGLVYTPHQDFHFDELENNEIFDSLEKKDYLLHHPYDSYDAVVNLFAQAADDPDVTDVWISVYRLSNNSPIVDALIKAKQNGKNVHVLMEVKARFDEAHNIEVAKQLSDAGVEVSTSFADWKVHAKMALVEKKDKSYAHFATGNYNDKSAHFYTDFSLLTSNEKLTADAKKLFKFLMTQKGQPKTLNELKMAPTMIRPTVESEIDELILYAKESKNKPQIWIKVNSLSDKQTIEKLYEASTKGVHIHLLVRGLATIKVNSPKFSNNIQVHSLVGRLLEHSREYLFIKNETDFKAYIASADVMPRNYDRRVELLIPILADDNKNFLYELFQRMWHDRAQSFAKHRNGKYYHREVKPTKEQNPIQELLLEEAEKSQNDKGTK